VILYDPDFYRRFAGEWRESARVLVPLVLELTEAKSVLDVGCGTGTWLALCRGLGVEDVMGVDGPWVDPAQLLIPAARFRHHDLQQPLDLGRRFDLVISLEVAEHVPEPLADAFVTSLTRHADAVMFSAAIPFQGGTGHVNEQWPAYWAEKFAARGMVAVDCLRPRVWADARVVWWYAQNTIVYATPAFLAAHRKLAAEHARAIPGPLPLVHPQKYLRVSDPTRGSLSRNLRALPQLAASSLRKRWRKRKG
jgi:SAM-dependent methyltransferase